MKKILISLVTAAALTLTGCSANSEKPVIDDNPASTVESATSTTSENSTSMVESTATSTTSSASTSATSSEKPVVSPSTKPVTSSTSSTSSEKPVTSPEKPVASSSTTSSTKPVEVPASPSVETPVVSSSTSSTKPVEVPTPAPSHNCKKDGHIWGESYTETYTEDFELVEKGHNVYGNGYDKTLARRYGCNTEPHFSDIFGMEYPSGSKTVKTTATRTVTEYYHKCSECGTTENYDTDETVTPSDNWVKSGNIGNMCPIIWWDVDNIPDEVYEWVEQDKQAREEWINNNF